MKPNGKLSVRVPESALASMDKVAVILARQRPGVRITRADTARMYLLAGMAHCAILHPERAASGFTISIDDLLAEWAANDA